MYTASLGSVANQEDWVVSFSLVDATETPLTLAAAAVSVFVCGLDNTSQSLLTVSSGSGVACSADGFTITWTVLQAQMKQLCAGNYLVFVRMLLNGVNSQIMSAGLSVVDGGPTS